MPRPSLIWIAIPAGPAIWFLSFGANFSLSGWVCQWQWQPALHAVSLVALAVAGGSALLGWSQWQKLGRAFPGETAGLIPRSRVLAIAGILLGSVSFLLILAQAIVQVILGGCE
jgi:hypothetical protein